MHTRQPYGRARGGGVAREHAQTRRSPRSLAFSVKNKNNRQVENRYVSPLLSANSTQLPLPLSLEEQRQLPGRKCQSATYRVAAAMAAL